jgi:hypothetical protein
MPSASQNRETGIRHRATSQLDAALATPVRMRRLGGARLMRRMPEKLTAAQDGFRYDNRDA